MNKSYPLAPMSTSILVLTLALWLLPFSFLMYVMMGGTPVVWYITFFLFVLYGTVWLFCRPKGFEISGDALAIAFPAWTRKIPLRTIQGVSELGAADFKKRYGWAMRIGVGGLWGGFGWLWTSRGGYVEFYVSRTDGLVMIERADGNNILITPSFQDQFTTDLSAFIKEDMNTPS